GYNQYYLYNTNTNLAWDTARANGTITIAVLDTGTFVNHPDLKANIDTRNMIDMYHAGVRPTPGTPSLISAQVPGGDNVGHGTHVAGILGAVADNGIGIAGTSYNAKILPIKVFDDKASNPSGDTATIIKACQYLKDCIEGGYVSNLRIVNMSLGYHPGSGEAPDTLLEAAIRDLRINYQVLTVCAAGNKGTTDASYPSDYDVSFSVTAVTRSNDRSSYSDYNQYKDISAPGDAIWSTWTGGSYRLDSGTSMASPVVAGIAALVWAAKPALNVDQVVQVLESTATTLPSQPVVSGSKGLVNAGAAVSSATTTTPAAKLALCEVAAIPSQLYTGSSITPQPTVKLGGTTLVLGTDYLLSYYNNTNVGNHTALVTITGRGAYGGQSIKRYFSIYKLTSVAGLSFSILATTQTFTGSALTPSVTIKDGSQTLVLNRDYKLAYANNTNVGTATLTVTGLGTYNGTKQLTFRIISRITRHDGPGRHETAAAASRAAYPSGAQAVVVASSEAFPDALAASSLAGAANAPILLTPSAQLYGATRTELVRLHPSKVYIIGGAGTISPNTYAQIQAALPGVTIKRLGGTTRYETAALIANETVALGGSRSQVFMVAGSNYPDALSVSSVAAYKKIPILLTDTNTLSAPAENFIVSRGIRDVTIVGGTGMVSTGIQNRLPSLGATTVLRASGADRYATALDFTTKAVSKWGLNPTLVGIASGADFPDSLSGGASIGNRGGLLLVTAPTALSNSAKTPLTTFKQRINSVEILGGTGAVTPSTETAIRNLLQ
ncbi:MAG: S8 family serine peptidase, partial [Coriobacteriales bacterium]|nr:S8 family serine peptidase [Coriobacteriales bacterium]